MNADLQQRAWAAAASVVDPEIPVLTIADLGVLRAVTVHDDRVEVAITPTYSGCPAMGVIGLEVELALSRAGIAPARVVTVMSPAWTTDWLTEDGRRKLLQSSRRAALNNMKSPRLLGLFSAEELGLALGLGNVIHLAFLAGRGADSWTVDVERLSGFRPLLPQSWREEPSSGRND